MRLTGRYVTHTGTAVHRYMPHTGTQVHRYVPHTHGYSGAQVRATHTHRYSGTQVRATHAQVSAVHRYVPHTGTACGSCTYPDRSSHQQYSLHPTAYSLPACSYSLILRSCTSLPLGPHTRSPSARPCRHRGRGERSRSSAKALHLLTKGMPLSCTSLHSCVGCWGCGAWGKGCGAWVVGHVGPGALGVFGCGAWGACLGCGAWGPEGGFR